MEFSAFGRLIVVASRTPRQCCCLKKCPEEVPGTSSALLQAGGGGARLASREEVPEEVPGTSSRRAAGHFFTAGSRSCGTLGHEPYRPRRSASGQAPDGRRDHARTEGRLARSPPPTSGRRDAPPLPAPIPCLLLGSGFTAEPWPGGGGARGGGGPGRPPAPSYRQTTARASAPIVDGPGRPTRPARRYRRPCLQLSLAISGGEVRKGPVRKHLKKCLTLLPGARRCTDRRRPRAPDTPRATIPAPMFAVVAGDQRRRSPQRAREEAPEAVPETSTWRSPQRAREEVPEEVPDTST